MWKKWKLKNGRRRITILAGNFFVVLGLGILNGLLLCLNLSQKSRTNIGVDYGWGNYGTTGLFIRLNENF